MDSVKFGADITTLLDLTPRDFQDNHYFPLDAQSTWWLPTPDRKIHPLSLSLQQFPFRGPTSFGQKFTFDVPSVGCGDILMSTFVQIELGHWLDDTSLCRFQTGQYVYAPGQTVWNYTNSLGTTIIERAELEVNGVTIESIDGDFLHIYGLLNWDIQAQYGIAVDGIGKRPFPYVIPSTSPFPTESGSLCIPLAFFFQRIALSEGFPLLAAKQGSVKIHITLRPFEQCITSNIQANNYDSCIYTSALNTPLGRTMDIVDKGADLLGNTLRTITTSATVPSFKKIQLITYTAHTNGSIRDAILRSPFECLVRNVESFSFLEPLKYSVTASTEDIINVQLPIEINHPMEEIIWVIRRKANTIRNDFTNYSSVTAQEYHPLYNKQRPLLIKASIYLNGIEIINKEEQWFRQHISYLHKGGIAAYSQFIYGYSFAKNPGCHQPSGTANASKLQSVKLALSVAQPGGAENKEWEVLVYVIRLDWLRFQNGLVNHIYMD
jgi:hypothetical protein